MFKLMNKRKLLPFCLQKKKKVDVQRTDTCYYFTPGPQKSLFIYYLNVVSSLWVCIFIFKTGKFICLSIPSETISHSMFSKLQRSHPHVNVSSIKYVSPISVTRWISNPRIHQDNERRQCNFAQTVNMQDAITMLLCKIAQA
jgi:hypothetical protein